MNPPLPIDPIIPDIADALARDRRAVLQAPPGTGKTTRVPPGLLRDGRLGSGRIVMLEPRRLAARAAAARIADEMGEPVGKTVGYRVRFDTKVGPETRIEVVTEGVLTRLVQADPSLAGIDLVIFDEFHERSLHGDLGLALCQETAALRDDLALLVMSATLDGAAVADLLGGAPVIHAEGRAHPVETRWHPAGAGRLEDQVADAVVEAMADDPASALVFLPGRREIERVRERLAAAPLGPNVDVLALYGDLPRAAQDRAIAPAPAGRHKIVLATSIAETSLTIEGVRIVVDSGLARRGRFDPGTGMTRLVTEPATRAELDQRRGRAGRTGPGIAIRLWPKAAEGGRPAFPPPEILDADLAPLALDLARWGARADQLSWLDPPPTAALAEAQALLRLLGAVDSDGNPTQMGRRMAALPLNPRLAHLAIAGHEAGDTATAVALAVLLDGAAGRVAERDLSVALARLGDGPQSPAFKESRRRLLRSLGAPGKAPVRPSAAGGLLALAYPDRVARRRPGGEGRYLMVSGRGARVDAGDPLVAAEWLAIAETDGRGPEARVFSAAPLHADDVAALAARDGVVADRVAWDRAKGEVVARRENRLGAIVLDAKPLDRPSADQIAAAFCQAVGDRGLTLLPWGEVERALQARAEFARSLDGGATLPAMDDAALLTALDQWLAPFLTDVSKLADLERVDLLAALKARISWDRMGEVDRLAPAALPIPSGRMARVDYTGDGPVIAAKLQELFGLTETPMVGSGAVPVAVHFLSPAGRPMAMSKDLAFFWAETYPQIRREMRGRYPKHPWPEDPLSATATARTKGKPR